MYRSSSAQVLLPKMAEKCKECGCACQSCFNDNSLDLHHEIEDLRAKLVRSNTRMAQMECEMVESQKLSEVENIKLTDELIRLRDRYERLLESHRKLQRINHNLEEKLISVVERLESEKVALQQDIASLNTKLVTAKCDLSELEDESDKLRNDCLVAVHLLQCKPSAFIEHKLNTLPIDLQDRLRSQMGQDGSESMDDATYGVSSAEKRTVRIPMATFPPTAMVYSMSRSVPALNPGESSDRVPLTLIAKVLTPRSMQRTRRLFVCHKCKVDIVFEDKGVQMSPDWHASSPPSPAHSSQMPASNSSSITSNGRLLYQSFNTNSNQLAGVHRSQMTSISLDT